MQPDRSSVLVQRNPSLIATHTVLRNTYLLLSFTVLFSAAMAGVALMTNAVALSPWIVLLGYMGLLFLTYTLKNSALGLVSVFALTGFMGWTLGPLLNAYLTLFSNGSEIIFTAFGATGVIFFALSGYVLITRKDFSFLGGFLFIGVIVALLAIILGAFTQMPGLNLAISAAIVLLMSGYILFDTSRIIHNGETNYIIATVCLYVDIFNLFVNLLNILGSLSGNRN